MKKIISYVLMSVIAVAAVMLTSCKKDETTGEARLLNLYLTPVQSLVEVGDTVEVKVYASYSNGDTVNVTAEAKIEVSGTCVTIKEGTGKVTGVSVGESVLSATYEGMTDHAAVISSEVDHLVLVANYETNKALMLPLDTLVKGEGFVLEAVLKSITEGGATYKKALDADKYEVTDVSDNLAIKDVEKKEAVIAKESGLGYINLKYKEKSQKAEVYVAELDTATMRVDVEISSDSADVMALGSLAAIIANAEYVWKDIKRKEKGKETEDTSAKVDIVSKLDLRTDKPQVIGFSGTSAVALQVGDASIYSVFEYSDTNKVILKRNVSVMKDTASCTYSVEVQDESVYAGETINYKYYANYSDGRTIELTNTRNDSILCVPVSKDKKGKVEFACTPVVSSGTYQLPDYQPFESMVLYGSKTFHMAVVYSKGGVKDTALSDAIDYYGRPVLKTIKTETDTCVLLTTGANSGSDTLYHSDEFSLVDSYGRDYTADVKIKFFEKEKVSYRYIPVSKVAKIAGQTLTLTYGPGKRSHTLYVEKAEE